MCEKNAVISTYNLSELIKLAFRVTTLLTESGISLAAEDKDLEKKTSNLTDV